jgi:acyl-lipid omega-6 desaturase (Delta-12 desaturase)
MPEHTASSTWAKTLSPYAKARIGRGLLDVATSVVPYLALSVATYESLRVSVLLALALAVPTAGFLVRTFVVFHDCTHGSLLPSRRANQLVGAVLGFMVLVPFARWRHDHAVHHASSGDLEKRGVGDLPTLTVAEYRSRSWRGRAAYRVFRNPVVMFGFGPIFAMIIGPRIATRAQRPRMRHSVLLTDISLVFVGGGLIVLLGLGDLLLTWAPAALMAGSAGIWLFYVQHQFEEAYWERGNNWCFADSALRGSSFLKLPKVLQFFSGNIGFHHVHHLQPRIPNYNLARAHREIDAFKVVPVLTLWDGLRAVRLKLWCEERRRMVTFAQARLVGLAAA